MIEFSQRLRRDDIATFALSIDGLTAMWTVELCGQIAQFTPEGWKELGHHWVMQALENAEEQTA